MKLGRRLAFFSLVILLGVLGPSQAMAKGAVVLRVAHVFKTDFSAHLGVAKFAELVKEKSGDTIKVEIYPNQQLGNERECLEGAKLGTHDIAFTGAAGWAIINPKLGIFELPFLYRDMPHQKKVFSSEGMRDVVDEMYGQVDLKFLAYYGYGIRSVLTIETPVRTVEDFTKLRIRVPEVPIFVKTFKALGANPTPINYGETYTALQTFLVGGVEGSPEAMVSMKFAELCKFYSLTQHQSPPILMAMNKHNFESKLTPEQQKLVLEAAQESSDWEYDVAVEANAKALREMEKAGIEIIQFPESERQRMIGKVKVVQEELAKEYGGTELIEKIAAIQ